MKRDAGRARGSQADPARARGGPPGSPLAPGRPPTWTAAGSGAASRWPSTARWPSPQRWCTDGRHAAPGPSACVGRSRRGIRPQPPEVQLDRLERLDAKDGGVLPRADDRPRALAQAQHLEGPVGWLDEPRVLDPGRGVDPELATAVDALGGGREHLADPVGGEVEPGAVGERGGAGTIRASWTSRSSTGNPSSSTRRRP